MEPLPFRFPSEQSNNGDLVAAWHNGSFHFGHRLNKDCNEHNLIPADKLIKGFKLLLYDEHTKTNQARMVRDQLRTAKKDLPQLMEDCLKTIWGLILMEAAERLVEVDHNRTVVYFPVPMLATSDTTMTIAKAAKRAGLPRVRFLYESLCAGVSILKALIGDRSSPESYAPFVRLALASGIWLLTLV